MLGKTLDNVGKAPKKICISHNKDTKKDIVGAINVNVSIGEN
jgi:hypothetical protein